MHHRGEQQGLKHMLGFGATPYQFLRIVGVSCGEYLLSLWMSTVHAERLPEKPWTPRLRQACLTGNTSHVLSHVAAEEFSMSCVMARRSWTSDVLWMYPVA